MPTRPTIDVMTAIRLGQLLNATYDTLPTDVTNQAGQKISAGGTDYTVVTTIYANDLSTDINPSRGDDEVSIGLICQDQTGDVAIAIRGTEGTLEWIHDAEFLSVPCPSWPVPVTPKTASPPCMSPCGRVLHRVRLPWSARWRSFRSPTRSPP